MDESTSHADKSLQPIHVNVPEEIIVHILSYVEPKTLLKLRSVSKLWKHLIDNEVWKLKVSHYTYLKNIKKRLPYYIYYWLLVFKPFERNFIRNNCGQDGLQYWNILSNRGDRWLVENEPCGSDRPPDKEEFKGYVSCFATSYDSCSKEQVIDLQACGVTGKIMDVIQPEIHVSEWYAGRFDCGCVYDFAVTLLNHHKEPLKNYEVRKQIAQWEGREWNKISKIFKCNGPGVRYISFFHGGRDTQFWAGHYGSKMSGASVKLTFPSSFNGILQNNNKESEEEKEEF